MSQEDLAASSDSEGEHDRDKTAPMCPACGSRLTRRSMRRSWQDRVKSAFGIWPYRCQMCNMRFTGRQDPESIAKHNATTEEAIREREEEARFLEEQARDREGEVADKHSDDVPRGQGHQ